MKITVFFTLLVAVSFFLGQWLKQNNQTTDIKDLPLMECDPSKVVCTVNYKTYKYFIEIEEKPTALMPFNVKLSMPDLQAESIEVSFDMLGMDMGYNIHQLIQQDSVWQARVILPVCSLNRNDWVMSVRLNINNEITVAKFKFKM